MSKKNQSKLNGTDSINKLSEKVLNALKDGRVKKILTEETNVIVNNAKVNILSVSSSVSNSIQHIERGNYPLHVLIAPKYPEGNLAHFFEYGTKPRYTKDGSYRGQIIATPFMRPAIDSNIKQVEKQIGARIKTEVQKLKK